MFVTNRTWKQNFPVLHRADGHERLWHAVFLLDVIFWAEEVFMLLKRIQTGSGCSERQTINQKIIWNTLNIEGTTWRRWSLRSGESEHTCRLFNFIHFLQDIMSLSCCDNLHYARELGHVTSCDITWHHVTSRRSVAADCIFIHSFTFSYKDIKSYNKLYIAEFLHDFKSRRFYKTSIFQNSTT